MTYLVLVVTLFCDYTDGLKKMKANACAKGEYEEWVDMLLERMGPCMDKIEAIIESLGLMDEQIAKFSLRKRSHDAILKLNEDIMSLEGRARQFEADASDRTRLVDRKTNSSRLLKEEKFRKDSKAR